MNRIRFLLMMLLFHIPLSVFPLRGFCGDIVFITHKGNPETSLSKNEIRDIFLGDKTKWDNNDKIRFVILRKGDTHTLFLKEYVHKTENNYVRYWKRMIVTGKGKMPKLLSDEDSVISYVAATEGAIGYVSESVIDNSVQKIKIE